MWNRVRYQVELYWPLAVFAMLAVTGLVLASRSEQAGTKDVVVVGGSLTLKSKDGKHTLTLSAGDNTVGIWVSSGKRHACIVSTQHPDSPYIGVLDERASGCPWAVFMDDKGNAVVQRIKDGKMKHEAK